MKVVFALIWVLNNGHYIPVKVGEYEKYSQCEAQGKALTAGSYTSYYKCVPVNATGR
jgi:hypothetical protein